MDSRTILCSAVSVPPRSPLVAVGALMMALSLSACANSTLEGEPENLRVGKDVGPGDDDMGEPGDDAGGGTDSGESGADMFQADAGNMNDDTGTRDGGGDMGADMGGSGDPCEGDPSSQGWEPVGEPLSALPGVSNAMTPSVAVDDSCRPIVAFHEDTETTEENIFVYRWEAGSGWVALGGAIDASGQDDRWTTGVQVTTDGDTPYIAWAEIKLDGDVGVFVAQWDGAEWQQLGNIPVGRLLSFRLSLSIDSMGRPVVAWNADEGLNTQTKVHAARYENTTWTVLGGPLDNDPDSNALALAPSLIHDAQDRPVIAWQEDNFIQIRRWEGSAWNEFVGGPVSSAAMGSAFDANLALAPGGDIVVGWRESGGGSTDVFVERWNGSAFGVIANEIDTEPETQGRTNTGNLSLTVDSQDRTVFAFDEPQTDGPLRVHVYRHDAGGLAPLGAALDANGGDTDGDWPDVAVDQLDRAIVAWSEEGATAEDVHVWRYTD